MFYTERDVLPGACLSAERERELFAKWRSTRRVKYRNEIVEHYLCLCVSLAVQIAGRGDHVDDLISAANVGLLAAAERFDASRGVRFGSYARQFIRGHVLRELRKRAKHTVDHIPADEDNLNDAVGCEDAPTGFAVDAAVDKDKIELALKRLRTTERRVIKGVYWQHKNFAEIARKMGVSREWVRKIHDGALAKLKGVLPS